LGAWDFSVGRHACALARLAHVTIVEKATNIGADVFIEPILARQLGDDFGRVPNHSPSHAMTGVQG